VRGRGLLNLEYLPAPLAVRYSKVSSWKQCSEFPFETTANFRARRKLAAMSDMTTGAQTIFFLYPPIPRA
jgi:hypothetical protein